MRAKKFLKKTFVSLLFVGLFISATFALYVGVIFATTPVKFDTTLISDSKLCVNIYDNKKRPLENSYLKGDFIQLNLIPKQTRECFLSIEDKDFYNHRGLNYKRIASAMIKNLTSFKFKEGASTISQQLIKNTHLSSDKTLKRKINEIKLTKALEKKMTKDEILEYYLNIIYFGDNCYGIQSASEHYFSHSATKLTLDEGAMLAGMIKSPNKYNPVKNYSASIKRRNLVLNEMKKDGKITESDFKNAVNKGTVIILNETSNKPSSYLVSAIMEAENILKLPEKQIAIGNYHIYTNMDKDKQIALDNAISSNIDEDVAMISINPNTANIEAYAQKSTINLINTKRQPASAIKPVLVYAPAINENIISPSTVILDDNISINGYEPKNIGDKHYGYVTTQTALANSLNIPAVKILSYIGINKAKAYLQKQNISFDKDDQNLAIALGGMTYGVTLKELTNLYQTLANQGKYIKSGFIDYITDKNGRVVYKNDRTEKTIFRDDTAYLTTTMLNESTKTGTAKRMSDLDFFVASKTGTSSISSENLDAYNISYTSRDVVGCWIGNIDNTPTKIVGGGMPTVLVKNYLNEIYKTSKPKNFEMPSSVEKVEIDEIMLNDEHIVTRADNYLPERYRKTALFSKFNLPKQNYSTSLTINPVAISGKAKNGVAEITFNANDRYYYDIYREENGQDTLVKEISCKKGQTTVALPINTGEKVTYYVISKIKNIKTGEYIESTKSNKITFFATYWKFNYHLW